MPVSQTVITGEGGWSSARNSGIEFSISGDSIQSLEIRLKRSSVFAPAGCMTWMTGATMSVSAVRGVGGGSVSRILGGGGIFLATFDSIEPGARIGLSPDRPGSIVPYLLDGNRTILCERGALLAAEAGVEVGGAIQKNLKAGLFGGEGIFLQAISGVGLAFLSCGGMAIEHSLARGETLLVNPGHVSFFEHSVQYEVEPVNGVKNLIFSGEGLFLAKLSGPGKVWTQANPGTAGKR